MESSSLGLCMMQRVMPFSREPRDSAYSPQFPIDSAARRIDIAEKGNGGSRKARVAVPGIAVWHDRENLGHGLVSSYSPTRDRTSGSTLLDQSLLHVSASYGVRAQSRLTK